MKKRKKYLFDFELDTIEVSVTATTLTEARHKAEAKLNRKKASSYIGRSWSDNRRKINLLDEHECD